MADRTLIREILRAARDIQGMLTEAGAGFLTVDSQEIIVCMQDNSTHTLRLGENRHDFANLLLSAD